MSNEIGTNMHSFALTLAAVKTPELDATLNHLVKAKEEWTGAPVTLMFAIKKAYTEDQLSNIPTIGDTTSNNPEIYKVRVVGKDGKPTDKEVSFFQEWPDNTPIGRAVSDELDWCKRASDKEMTKEGIPEAWLAEYSSSDLIYPRKKYLAAKKNNIRQAYKKAVQLMQQIDMVNELSLVKAFVVPGIKPGTYENLVQVQTTVEGREALDREMYSIGQFLKVNVAKAYENGGSFAAVKATLERAPKKPGGTPEAGIPKLASIETPETLDKVLVAAHSYLDKIWSGRQGVDYANLVKYLTGPNSASAVETIGDLADIFNHLLKMDKIAFIYAKTKDDAARAA